MSLETLPTHWLSLVTVVFVLGLKHGLDPDILPRSTGSRASMPPIGRGSRAARASCFPRGTAWS